MRIHRHALPSQDIGTRRELISLHFGGNPASGRAYLQASLHADELPGMLVMHHLRQLLTAAETRGRIRGEVVLVPMANPIGLSQHLLYGQQGRFELGSAENFNRNYPELLQFITPEVRATLGPDERHNAGIVREAIRQGLDRQEPVRELDALRMTLTRLAFDADVVLDLHCDLEAVMHLYTEEVYWPQAEPLARLLGANTVLLAMRSGGQSFDEAMSGVWWQLRDEMRADGHTAAIPLACLSATVELRGQSDISHEGAKRDAQALFDFLIFRGIIEGPKPALPAGELTPTPLAGSDSIRAPHAGVVVYVKSTGDWIERGDTVADLLNVLDDQLTPIVSETSGVFYARSASRYARRGDVIARVAGALPIRSGNLLSP